MDSNERLPLWNACYHGRSECVDFLLSVTPIEFILYADINGDNCLHIASIQGQATCVECICRWITHIDDLHCVNNKGYTPGHLASNSNVLKVLFEYGVDLWILDILGT